jgi:hypothetical protein
MSFSQPELCPAHSGSHNRKKVSLVDIQTMEQCIFTGPSYLHQDKPQNENPPLFEMLSQ